MALASAVMQESMGAESDYSISMNSRYEYVENPARVPGVDTVDHLVRVGLDASLERSTQHFLAAIKYSGMLMDYRDDLQEDRHFFTGTAQLVWQVVPEHLSWELSNSRTFQLLDSSIPDTPDNRQVVDVTSTGPDVVFQLTGRDRVQASYRYSVASYQENAIPSQDRQTATAIYTHLLSTRLAADLKVEALTGDFDDPLYPGFDRYSATLGANFQGEKYTWNLEAGEVRTKRDLQSSNSGSVYRAGLEYLLNSRNTISVSYSESVEDLISNMLSPLTGGVGVGGDYVGDRLGNSNLTQIYEQVMMQATYRYSRPESFEFTLGFRSSERDYEDNVNSQEDDWYNLNFSFPVGNRVNLDFFARYSELNFLDFDRLQKREEVGASAVLRASSRLTFRFSVLDTKQRGTGLLDDYEGLNAFVEFSYRLH